MAKTISFEEAVHFFVYGLALGGGGELADFYYHLAQ